MTPEEELRQKLIAESLREKVPLAVLDPTCKWTTNRDQVAVEALNRVMAGAYEEGGVIFQNERGEYCYSIPVGNELRGKFKFGVQPTSEMKMAGIYHTHPPVVGLEKDTESFSPEDVAMADQLKTTSYIKALRSGAIKKYEPGTSRTKRVGGVIRRFSEGEPIPLAFPAE